MRRFIRWLGGCWIFLGATCLMLSGYWWGTGTHADWAASDFAVGMAFIVVGIWLVSGVLG